MLKCETCGKLFKNTQGLNGHIAHVHLGKNAEGNPVLKDPPRGILSNTQGMKMTFDDLCPDCQEVVKDKLVRTMKEVEVTPGGSPGGFSWLLVGLIALAILGKRPSTLTDQVRAELSGRQEWQP